MRSLCCARPSSDSSAPSSAVVGISESITRRRAAQLSAVSARFLVTTDRACWAGLPEGLPGPRSNATSASPPSSSTASSSSARRSTGSICSNAAAKSAQSGGIACAPPGSLPPGFSPPRVLSPPGALPPGCSPPLGDSFAQGDGLAARDDEVSCGIGGEISSAIDGRGLLGCAALATLAWLRISGCVAA